jgi:hypothetical protein
MNFQLDVLESVYEELENVIVYYEDRRNNLGLSFLNDWENALI